MKNNELVGILMDLQQSADYLGVDADVFKMHMAFYNAHKIINGSYRGLKNPLYSEKMQERYDHILCQINQTIEGLVGYNKMR